MNKQRIINGAFWNIMIAVTAVTLLLPTANIHAQARIEGITGTTFSFTARGGEVSTPDGGALHFWGYEDTTGAANPFGLPQYPGPTLILTEDVPVTITLTSNLPYGQATSIMFPGHQVTASGGSPGLLTQESTGPSVTVTYEFTPTEPGTYMYYSGTEMELQVEMGLFGAIIVRPALGEDYAYNHEDTQFDHEYLFLLSSMDFDVHMLAEQGLFDEIDMTTYHSVYWFINGRAAPDDLAGRFVPWLPHQPYNSTPRMTPGQKLLMRIIGAGQEQHPFHFHGNNADLIARDGRMLSSTPDPSVNGPDLSVSLYTKLSVPGETVDQIFTWTGENIGWDIYGTGPDQEHECNGKSVNDADPASPGIIDPTTLEDCSDHGKEIPVILPEKQNLAFGGWYSGSPFMGDIEPLPPGEGGLNPHGGYFFMWHSHAEKELCNFDIFPGGMLTMMVVEPPNTPIP
jgi:FtsP/CotA-like multicopper oxidase with cupredoxin domain